VANILVAEDDPSVRSAVERALKHEKHTIISVKDGAEALEKVTEQSDSLDLIVMDIMMPFMSGIAVCKYLRERGNQIPILIITARHEISDRVAGLDAGADDYMVKPFSLKELFARIRALLRRTSVNMPDNSEGHQPLAAMQLADLSVDPASRRATRDGKALNLTKTEFDILELLVFNAGKVLSREFIYERIWGYDFASHSKSLDVHVGYLRRKMEADGMARLLNTVRGVGYIVEAPQEA